MTPVTISPFWVIARYRKFGMALSYGCDSEDFIDRGDAGATLGDPIFEHGCHSEPSCGVGNRPCVAAICDQVADFIGCFEDLEDPGAPAITGSGTALASA